MKFWITILSFLFLGFSSVSGQNLDWTSFSELNEKFRGEPKPLLVFIHADWCKYCAMQENNTFSDPDIVDYLNENFYCLKLNGETKEEISFLNRKYAFSFTGAGQGQHQLAEFLGKKEGSLSYPTTVILSESFQLTARENRFLDREDLIQVLNGGR